MKDSSQPLISGIRVEDLFGLYTYRLPASGTLKDAAILYGDNGVGKSTILRLAFHLLSAAEDRGHRTALFKVSFKSFEVDLVSGVCVRAAREPQDPLQILQLSVIKNGQVLARWDYIPRSRGTRRVVGSDEHFWIVDDEEMLRVGQSSTPWRSNKKLNNVHFQGEEKFLTTLREYVPTMFILNADRRLDSDSVSNPSDEVELRKVMRYEEPKHINDLVARSREIALSQAVNTASNWVSRKALQGANQGSMNVHSVYVDVLRRVVDQSAEKAAKNAEDDAAGLIRQLKDIEKKTENLARYELATTLSISEFYKALSSTSAKSNNLASELLEPYIQSLEGRLLAVEPVYHAVDRFVTILNLFLSDKALSFKLSQGFRIQNRLGTQLEPSQLSSGEQQLLLLFYNVLTCRDKPSIFIIDEPEISLNIKWQRKLVQSLLDITEGARIKFIFASHSMELLAQHRDRVVRMEEA